MTITAIGTTYMWPYPTSGVIVVIATIQRAFQNAHHALLKKRGRPPTGPHMGAMKQWWWEEYGITVLKWSALEFSSDQALTMFLLRWS
jgi:hypothetical protein